jgi:hypothetical protein
VVLSILCGAWVVFPILCKGLGSFCLFCVGVLVVLSILCENSPGPTQIR